MALDPATLPAKPTLVDGVTRHLANRGRREDLDTRIRTSRREATFAPPLALTKLAEIADFTLYLATTFDSLLENAINAVRFGGSGTGGGPHRGHGMAAEAKFILPVCIDATPEKGALVPEPFLKGRWTRLPGGVVTADIVGRWKEMTGGGSLRF